MPPRPMRSSMRYPATTVPTVGSGGRSGIICSMADTSALHGAWVLVAGPDAATAARLRARLADLGAAAVELALDADEAAARAAASRPDAVLALPGFGAALRARLDPLGLGSGPPVVAVDALPGLPGGAAGD